FPFAREFKRVSNDAVACAACKNGFLHRHIVFAVAVQTPADFGVFTLAVLAHDDEVDLSRLASTERTCNSFKKPDGAQIDILSKATPDGYQLAPERDVVRHARITDRAQTDRVVGTELIESIRGHHATRLQVGLTTPIEVFPRKRQVKTAPGGLQHPQALGHHFTSNPVALNNRDLVIFQRTSHLFGT